MQKKGQAAMEFLSTYGWAILATILTGAALFYFSAIYTTAFIPDQCFLETGIVCKEFSIYDTGHISLILTNEIGKVMKSLTLTIEDLEGNTLCVLSGSLTLNYKETSLYSTDVNAIENINCRFTANKLIKFKTKIEYETENGVSHSSGGDLTVTPIKGPPEEITANCNDGILDPGEVCDSDTRACTITGYDGTQTCNQQCTAYGACITPYFCSDGNIQGSEECDDGNLDPDDGCNENCYIE